MRPSLVLATVLGLLAGCVTPSGSDDGQGPLSLAGYTLDCDVARGDASWQEPCLALASPNDSPSKSEIDLVVNPNDPENVVTSSKDLDPTASDCVWAVPQVTKDGGRTWATNIIGGPRDERQPNEPLYGWRCITDPIMAWDAGGTLYYSLQAYDHTLRDREVPAPDNPLVGVPSMGSSILMARSKDGGSTWEKVIPLHEGAGPIFHDYMRMAINPQTKSVFTIWNQFNTNGVFADVPGVDVDVVPVIVASRDGGETAAPPVYITKGNSLMNGFAIANDGTMYVLLEVGADEGWLTKSTDDGRTWSEPRRIEQFTSLRIERQLMGPPGEAYRTTGGYELVVDNSGGPRDGWVYATISDASDPEDPDIYVSVSKDKGETWSEPVQVNTGEFDRGVQWIPRPVVDRLGTLHLVYFDNSRNETWNSTMQDVTWALSTDGGQTFQNARLTTIPSDGNLGIHQDGFPFIGDYNGISTSGDWLYMGFPTTHTGRAEIAVAKVRLPAS